MNARRVGGGGQRKDASATRRAAACATTRPARSTTARSARRDASVESRSAIRTASPASRRSAIHAPRRAASTSPTSTRWMNDSSARRRLVERRAAVVQPRASERRGAIGVPKPRDDAGVGRHQPGRAQEQRRLPRSARSDERHRFSLGDREIHVGESVRARQARPTPRDESLGDPRDFERHSHADR